jgi:tRNA(Ile2)-agmatinylcytidine synthase
VELHIGIDDTDSKQGGCTTYIAARLVEKLSNIDTKFADYPNIIRLNPNIPYKTRGNAAVALRLAVPGDDSSAIQEAVIEEVEKNSQSSAEGTDPAVVFLKGKPPVSVKHFSRRAMCDVLDAREAMKTLKRSSATAVAYGTGLGLVGALSAIGQTLTGDHTFELVAYRLKKNCGTTRRVNEHSVMRMDRLTRPGTFNNYDFGNKRMLVTPHGPDPVLLGIRGETPQIVVEAFRMLKIQEPVERWVVFRTNHGTDAHLKASPWIGRVEPFRTAVLRGFCERQSGTDFWWARVLHAQVQERSHPLRRIRTNRWAPRNHRETNPRRRSDRFWRRKETYRTISYRHKPRETTHTPLSGRISCGKPDMPTVWKKFEVCR